MAITQVPKDTTEEQKVLFSYFDTVLIDFDTLIEPKKEKDEVKKKAKKTGNK